MEKRKPLILDFFNYITSPNIFVEKKPQVKKILFNITRLWSLIFFLSMFFALVSNFLLSKYGYSDDDFALTEILKDSSFLLIFFLVVLWAPISEEIAFRLWLRYSPVKWGVGLSFFTLFTLLFFNPPFLEEGLFSLDTLRGLLNTGVLLITTFLFVFLLLRLKKIGGGVKSFFEKNFKFFFYTTGIFFAVIHLENYDVNLKEIWFFVPLLIFPQLFLSFTISFIRMKYGFIWSILTHALNNVVAVTPILFLSPILENNSFAIESLQDLPLSQTLLILFVFLYFVILFGVCIFSIVSLTLEFTKKR